MTETDLIRRLQERIKTEPTVDMEICPPIRPNPPVTEADLMDAEADLGFPLPPLVRALYSEVGDGGFGPGYGLNRLVRSEGSLVESRKSMNWINEYYAAEPGGPYWPEEFIEIVNWGCHYFSAIDCLQPSCPVYFFNNDQAAGGARPIDCLYPEADSLADWLWAWLDAADLWESFRRARWAAVHTTTDSRKP